MKQMQMCDTAHSPQTKLGPHMGPDNLCHVTRHLLFFSLCHHATFYKTLTSLSTVIIKGHVLISTTFKVAPCHTSCFTHVEP